MTKNNERPIMEMKEEMFQLADPRHLLAQSLCDVKYAVRGPGLGILSSIVKLHM